MTGSRLSAHRALSPAFGVVMIAAAEPQTHPLALWASGVAITAVVIGMRFRIAATLAVLLTALALALSAPPPMLAVLSGLSATAYLVMRHVSVPNSATPTRATAVAALSFGLAGAVITIFPLDVGWLPLIAPFGLLGAFAIATHPYMRQPNQS
jgi:uncharacterized membrane protein YjjB (DUF3815 family)